MHCIVVGDFMVKSVVWALLAWTDTNRGTHLEPQSRVQAKREGTPALPDGFGVSPSFCFSFLPSLALVKAWDCRYRPGPPGCDAEAWLDLAKGPLSPTGRSARNCKAPSSQCLPALITCSAESLLIIRRGISCAAEPRSSRLAAIFLLLLDILNIR